MNCNLPPSTPIPVAANQTLPLDYFNITEGTADCLNGGKATYIRSHHGGSLLPWPYTLVLLIIHLPVTILRVTRWQKVQALSIVLAVVSIFVTAQAYTTRLKPDYIMVWMPLPITLDIGAMMQLAFLIIQENGAVILWRSLKHSLRLPASRISYPYPSSVTDRRASKTEGGFSQAPGARSSSVRISTLHVSTPPRGDDLVGKAWVALLAFVLMIILLALQLTGLGFAGAGMQRTAEEMEAQWCSPVFQGGGSVIADCSIRDILPGENETIDCIKLPGTDQKKWLVATVAIISVSLVAQIADAIILVYTTQRGKRPWVSMFFGNMILLGIMGASIYNALHVPVDVHRGVWVFKPLPDGGGTVCEAKLRGPGVRGEIIAWSDGFLGSWGVVYNGGSE